MNTERPRQCVTVWRMCWAWIFTIAMAGSLAPIASAGAPVLQPQKLIELPWGKGLGQLGIRAARTASGQTQYVTPSDFDADRKGNLYIADPVNRRVVILAAAGQWQTMIPIPFDRAGSAFLAVGSDGGRILTSQPSSPFAFCEYDRQGKRVGCTRLPPNYVYRTLARPIGISSAGTIYALAFHPSGEQHDSLFEFHDALSPPRTIITTKGRAQTLRGPFLRDFRVWEETVLVAMAQKDGDDVWHGKYVQIRPAQQAIEYFVPESATGRLVGLIGNQVAAFPGDLNMEGPAELELTILAENGAKTTAKYILPYPSADIYSDSDGTKLVFRMIARTRFMAMAATKSGVLMAEYSLPSSP